MINYGSFLEYENSIKKITDFTQNGSCSKCGNCCSDSLCVTQNEINVIKRYVKKHNISEVKHFLPLQNCAFVDLTCPFLDNSCKESKCLIYDIRPEVCRVFDCSETKKCSLYQINNYPKLKKISMRQTFFGDNNSKTNKRTK